MILTSHAVNTDIKILGFRNTLGWDLSHHAACLATQAGVNADALSRSDLLNAPGEKYSVKLTTPGTYGIYCEPHQGAGMVGKIIVQ